MNTQNNLFGGLYTDLWRKMVPEALTIAETQFITSLFPDLENLNVLDLMCGFGRHAIQLIDRGHRVLAIDESKRYVTDLSTVNSERLSVKCEDIRKIHIHDKYDCIICMGNSIGSLNKHEQRELIRKCFDGLKESGKMIINSWMITEIIAKRFQQKEWFQVDEITYLISNSYLFNPTRLESTHTLIQGEKVRERINDIDYVVSIGEYIDLFSETGFATPAFYSTPRRRPFQLGDEHCYIVAEK